MKKTCSWCHKPTNLPKVFAAKSPILEWFEDRINTFCEENDLDKDQVWGQDSDWGKINIPEHFEAELLTYDELMVTLDRRTICKHCLVEDQKLWEKYYKRNEDGEDTNGDFEITIDDLK